MSDSEPLVERKILVTPSVSLILGLSKSGVIPQVGI